MFLHFSSGIYLIIESIVLKSEARHPAVLGGHVVPEEVLGEVHGQPLVSPASLVLVSVSVALLVEVAVLRCLETDIDKHQLLKI